MFFVFEYIMVYLYLKDTRQPNCPCNLLTLSGAKHPDAPYFSILLCLTPDDFTRQVESAATQWVNSVLSTHSHQRLGTMCIHLLVK